MTKKVSQTNKEITKWLKKKAKLTSDEQEVKEAKFVESLKFLKNLKTWEDVKKAYQKTATVYSEGILSEKQVQTILSILNSYAEIIEKKELNALQEDYMKLLEQYKKLQEVLKNDDER